MLDKQRILRSLSDGEQTTLAVRIVADRPSAWRTVGTITRRGDQCAAVFRVAADVLKDRLAAAVRDTAPATSRGWVVEFGLRNAVGVIEPVAAASLTKRHAQAGRRLAGRLTRARRLPGGPAGPRPGWPAAHRFLSSGCGRGQAVR